MSFEDEMLGTGVADKPAARGAQPATTPFFKNAAIVSDGMETSTQDAYANGGAGAAVGLGVRDLATLAGAAASDVGRNVAAGAGVIARPVAQAVKTFATGDTSPVWQSPPEPSTATAAQPAAQAPAATVPVAPAPVSAPVTGEAKSTPYAANVSNPAQLAADQQRYDAEKSAKAAYDASPAGMQAAQMANLQQLSQAAVAQIPQPEMIQPGGAVSQKMAEMINAKRQRQYQASVQAAQAPFAQGMTQMVSAGHTAALSRSDPLHQEQVAALKGSNASAARVSELQSKLVDPKTSEEDAAKITSTLRSLAGKEDGIKIANEQTPEGTTKGHVVHSNGDVVPIAEAQKATAERARKKQTEKTKAELATNPKLKGEIDAKHATLLNKAKEAGNRAAILAQINSERSALGLDLIK